MQEMQSKIDLLDQSVDILSSDVHELKNGLNGVQKQLCSRFDQLDTSIQELKVVNAKVQEQMASRQLFEELIKTEMRESKAFQSKIFLALLGGGISLIIWLIQGFLSR